MKYNIRRDGIETAGVSVYFRYPPPNTKDTSMAQLQYTQTQYSIPDIAITTVMVIALVYIPATAAEWLHSDKPLASTLERQWRWVRGLRIW